MKTPGLALLLCPLLLSPRAAFAEEPKVVALDPGHGGSNTGAPGVDGSHEKQTCLAVARLVGQRLAQRGVRVVTTRDRDEYLTLGERVRRVNTSGADLFLSLHGNSSPEHQQRGVETYVLGREVTDVLAQRAATAAEDPTRGLIARQQVREQARRSVALAQAIQGRLGALRPPDRGVRQAAYDVLDGVTVPAALVEIGFVDHPVEGRELLDRRQLDLVAQAIVDGIADFLHLPDDTLAHR